MYREETFMMAPGFQSILMAEKFLIYTKKFDTSSGGSGLWARRGNNGVISLQEKCSHFLREFLALWTLLHFPIREI